MKPLFFNLPLGERPRLRLIGRGVHGRTPVERYRLKGLWCLHLYSYHAHLSIGGKGCDIEPSCLGVLPPDTNLVYRFNGRSEHLFAHFQLRDSRVVRPIPAIQRTSADYPRLRELFEEAVGYFAAQPLRAEIRLWDLLWRAADAPGVTAKPRVHPAVEEVARQIELRLHEPLLVESLAREVGLSHNHLIRQFHAGLGKTVKGYMMTRRLEKARHLLCRSSLSIKNIAQEVGLGDL
ncbi:MAG TPA: AraC family transcriptional regulator, partial [Candidatus Methylacidiphilales bacterium]|nr:AraC family transcriptional regulator [Candidatus Methylacidiphilales bacterium]